MAKNVVINEVTYSNVPEVNIPQVGGGTARFYDPSDATAIASSILNGETAYINGGLVTGSMPINSGAAEVISTKNDFIQIAEGYHDGLGGVGISATEKAKIVTGNIKSGVSILGVSGKASVVDTAITSSAAAATDIATGKKAYVNGTLLTGSLKAVTVSQNASSKVLTIE